MTWADVLTEPTRKPSYPTRPTYTPPQVRLHNPNPIPSSYAHYTHPRFNSTQLGQPSSARGRGYGRRYSSTTPRWTAKSPTQIPFEGIHIADDTINNETNVGVGSASAINFDAYEDIPVEATGDNIPPPVAAFDDIDLGEGLNRNIRRCKYVKPTPVQRHAIPIAVAGRDLMACAQTGSGKTAAFCFPIICGVLGTPRSHFVDGTRVAYPLALILSPTRELSCQIHDEANKFAFKTGVRVVVAYGGTPISQQFRKLERGVDILVATPGRLVDMIERARVSLRKVRYLALDEADRMLDMGFEPQIRKIVQQMDMPPPGTRQTMLFSATFPNEIQRLASDFLSNYIFLAVGRVGSSTDLITQRVELVQEIDKRKHLIQLLRAQKANGNHGKHALTVVFVETKKGADILEHWLSMHGFPAIAIHGDKVQMERERALRSFKSGATPILVATDVAARGLDIPHVAHVINFDLPKDIDAYVHRIGRTGRAGKSGLATAFFSDKNQSLARALVELMQEANQEVPSWLFQYAESSTYGSTNRANKPGGSKFGGYDFRYGAQSGSDTSYHLSAHGNVESSVDSYAASPGAVCCSVPANSDYYAAASADSYETPASSEYFAVANDYNYSLPPSAECHAAATEDSYGSVVPSGWD
ncbi:DEAD domain-containing protein/Helicase_C domain-containing protein [Cephalotus follicularis]|uniref:RNA helicase n=1 Tax=Cephalotus follicularis TaxID=3775 RepID=A0A1Q3BKH0_CEPFO|nr:DEAD domain-containing protein/Helicase_C domain-containing protein [Cephalotus follicularis]